MEGNDDKLDTTVELITPENIVFRYYVAGPAHRIPAFFLDCVCQFVIFMGTMFALVFITLYFPFLDEIAGFLLLMLMFLIFWLYGGILESVWNGRTFGKWAFGLRVVTVEGLPITPFQALMRNLLRAADLQPFGTGWVGLLTMMLNRRFQRLGDLACKTMVIIDRVPLLQVIPLANQPEMADIAERLPARLEFHPSVVRALLLYVHRREWLSLERRNEIAAPLAEALRKRYGLPPDAPPDLVVCAAYQKGVLGVNANQGHSRGELQPSRNRDTDQSSPHPLGGLFILPPAESVSSERRD